MIQLVHGTKETINVTVQDTSGALTTLDTTTPRFTVVPQDATGADKNAYYYKYFNKTGLNSGMMVQCLLDTTVSIQYNVLEATAAPVVPVTIVAGTNDQFKFNSVSYTFPAGVYTTVDALATAMMASVDGSAHALEGVNGVLVVVTDNGKLALVNDMVINTTTGFYDSAQIQNGTTHNALPSLGFANNQAMPNYNANVVSAWALGNYDLYVTFLSGTERPYLGPVALQVI